MSNRISVITVTYNSEGFIKKYLHALLTNLTKDDEVIIVDNGSSDQTVKIISKIKDKRIKLIEAGANLGFSKGCNLGFKSANGEYLLFLNPDTEVYDGSINILFDYLRDHPQTGIVVPKLVQSDGKVQPSVRHHPTILNAIREYYLGHENSYKQYFPLGDDPVRVQTAYGAVMLMRKDVYTQLGGFDERYFMYFEDLDLCRRVYRLGLDIIYLPNAVFKHQVGGSVSSQKERWLKQSAIIYHGRIVYWLLYLVLRLRPIK